MASPSICSVIISLFFGAYLCSGQFEPITYMHMFGKDEEIYVQVSSLSSLYTQLPRDYYSLPFCKPSFIKHGEENLGQLLIRERIQNSPYRLRITANEYIYLCTSNPLTKQEVEVLRQRTQESYQVNMILDNMPAIRYTKHGYQNFQSMGFPAAFSGYYDVSHHKYYISNHLKFRVLVHKQEVSNKQNYRIVGFEVTYCSIKRNLEEILNLSMYSAIRPTSCPTSEIEFQVIEENERVEFTYEVQFAESGISWSARWERYLEKEGLELHWFSILNSVVTIIPLAGLISFKISRMLAKRRGGQPLTTDWVSRSKLLTDDTMLEPSFLKLLCVMVGSGTQIAGMAIATILIATFGFMPLSSRGSLLTGIIALYILFSIVAGYIGCTLWINLKQKSEGLWSVLWYTACFFPGSTFVIFAGLNYMHYVNESTATVSLSVCLALLALWLCASSPLTLLGGLIAARLPKPVQFQIRISQNPRKAPRRRFWSWFLVLLSGGLSFGFILVELFFVYSSIWMGRFYYNFGFLLIAVLFLLSSCALVSIGVTCRCLATEDREWWWKAFFASGSVGFYVFLYSLKYLMVDLVGLSGPVPAAIYTGVSMIISLSVMLSTGAIGFISAFMFLRYHALSEKY